MNFYAHLGRVDSRERSARYGRDGHLFPSSHQRSSRGKGLLFLELRDSCLELSEFRLRTLEELALYFEILAHHQIHAVEPTREQGAEIFLDVLGRRIFQCVRNPLVQLLEQPLIDHAAKVTLRS